MNVDDFLKHEVSRRQFLGASAKNAAGVAVGMVALAGATAKAAPGERVRVATIGVRNQGTTAQGTAARKAVRQFAEEPFEPLEPGRVTMYVCGPTVYKPSHIGHMVGPVIFDTVKRYLEYLGYKVEFVVNITDVDDKLIKRAAELNTPMNVLRTLPPGQPVPQFWLGAGLLDAQDVHSAQNFGQLLQLRQPGVTVKLVPGDGHTMVTWRGLLPGMLSWMTRGLSQEVTVYNSPAAQRRRAEAARARAKTAQLDQRRAQRPVPKSSVTPGVSQARSSHLTS